MLGVGLYGANGHQIQHLLHDHPHAKLIGYAAFDNPPAYGRRYETLEAMLQDDGISLVSLCSPRRAEQAEHAILCMKAGKHVYAEKPCAFTEADLDRIMETAAATGMRFHEMAGTAFEEPYWSIGQIVQSGQIGEVIQILTQKSYPYHDRRPQDEAVDGGLLLQVSVHALRMIEHAAGLSITDITAAETTLGNPGAGDLRMAATIMMRLANGALAVTTANYLNPEGHGQWGNDHLRIFGTKGFVESTDGGLRTRLVIGDTDHGPVPQAGNRPPSYFDMLVSAISNGANMPLSPEAELHPTRMLIRAKHGLA